MAQRILVPFLLLFVYPALAGEAKTPAGAPQLATKLEPFLSCLGGKEQSFHLKCSITAEIDRRDQNIVVQLRRLDGQSFVLAIEHDEYPLRLDRTAESTRLLLPAKGIAFTGTGPVEGADTLEPRDLIQRLVSQGSAVYAYGLVLTNSAAPVAAALLENLAGLKSENGTEWSSAALKEMKLRFSNEPPSLEVTGGDFNLKLERLDEETLKPDSPLPEKFKEEKKSRAELERLIARGVRRALEVLAPSPWLMQPARQPREVQNGKLRWVEDQRLVLLSGTPREVGLAHGKLLKEEARRCADSVIYLIGAVQTVRSGKWFLDELRSAYRRLEPFIPPDQIAEIDALAEGAGVGREEARLANVFPELFHCSGFALFGKATAGGKLYHGRVLDYMTAIGLQDSAAIMVIRVDGKIPFATIGYAGFIGSVSGMNARQISLGEMGGRGEGHWDGVPMATLMRRALEECSTLEEVVKLWTDSPRTCEYFYVFADGKIPDAVGVGATPGKIEFVKPGKSHPLLGEGIPDAVILSADDRLKLLRKRVQENYGEIDQEKAMWLMSRPVAMRSNLHNVLFIPQDLVFYVAHADRKEIAAKRPYVRFELGPLLEESPE